MLASRGLDERAEAAPLLWVRAWRRLLVVAMITNNSMFCHAGAGISPNKKQALAINRMSLKRYNCVVVVKLTINHTQINEEQFSWGTCNSAYG